MEQSIARNYVVSDFFILVSPVCLQAHVHVRQSMWFGLEGKILTDNFHLAGAFFDMYLGDIPVSEQTKEDIGNNVGSILRRC